jgi:hypothetical protein
MNYNIMSAEPHLSKEVKDKTASDFNILGLEISHSVKEIRIPYLSINNE